jgi:hypothetical protein
VLYPRTMGVSTAVTRLAVEPAWQARVLSIVTQIEGIRHAIAIFLAIGGIVAVGLAIWGLWGNPRHSAPKKHVAQHLNVDPELKIVSERSPFMRTER